MVSIDLATEDDRALPKGSRGILPIPPRGPGGLDLEASGTICVSRPTSRSEATHPAADAQMLDGEELVAGNVVGNYVIREMIGRGGCGTVYAAAETGSEQPVAIKVLRLSLASSNHQVRRFVQEARALTLIDHPGIVEVYDTGYLPDGRPYFVMELLEGRSLANILAERGRFSPAEALELLEPICDMLELAHRAGIVHRDIKASNIMLTGKAETYQVKLLDFGLAKLLNGEQSGSMQTSMGVVLGTLHSMAPEQIIGGTIDSRTDIYALGALLHRLLTGRHPFEDIDGQKVARMHLHKPPPQPSQLAPVPPALDAVVRRSLDKDPGRRFQSAGAFFAALSDAVGTKTTYVQRAGEAVAIYVEARVAAGVAFDESLFGALMAALDAAESALAGAGYQVLLQTTNAILAARLIRDRAVAGGGGDRGGAIRDGVSPPPESAGDVLQSAVEVAMALRRRLTDGAHRDQRIHVNVCLHRGRAVVKTRGEQSKIAGGAIIDVSRWAPRRNLDSVCVTSEIAGSAESVPFVPASSLDGESLARPRHPQ